MKCPFNTHLQNLSLSKRAIRKECEWCAHNKTPLLAPPLSHQTLLCQSRHVELEFALLLWSYCAVMHGFMDGMSLVRRQPIFCGIMLPASSGTPVRLVGVLSWHSFPPHLTMQPKTQILIGLFSHLGVALKNATPLPNEDVLGNQNKWKMWRYEKTARVSWVNIWTWLKFIGRKSKNEMKSGIQLEKAELNLNFRWLKSKGQTQVEQIANLREKRHGWDEHLTINGRAKSIWQGFATPD